MHLKFPSTILPQTSSPTDAQKAHLDMLAKVNQTHADALSAATQAQAAAQAASVPLNNLVAGEPSMGTPHEHFAVLINAVPGSDAVRATSLAGIVPVGTKAVAGTMSAAGAGGETLNVLDITGVNVYDRVFTQVNTRTITGSWWAPLDGSLNLRWKTVGFGSLTNVNITMTRYFE